MIPSPKILAVIGATGQQGGSVINYVLNHPELSEQYKLRAVTRNPSKPEAKALQERGVEVVKGDLYDKESLKNALKGAHSVFGLTTTCFDDSLYAKEIIQGKNLADAAVDAGLHSIIFSTLHHAGDISEGKYHDLDIFNVKADIEKYIRSLPIKSAFFAPSMYYQNFYMFYLGPQPQDDGTFAIVNVASPQSVLPHFDVVGDTGKFVGAILAEPEKFEGKILCAAAELRTFDEIAEIISKATGKTVKYKQVAVDAYDSALPASHSKIFGYMIPYIEKYGYFGPEEKELVEWSTKSIHDRLTTLEEYLQKHPLNL
ncbi:hypothetical protein BX616_006331 [Lobosporangium transversale]|uniref:NmrA-like domain-containing protein n=1 Tax=Lobosporangium transversale TaxID=64571 RepID=A0A1Y2GBQ1_9FUNG|nr:hypothetical protein BCR41DRAFT_361179 [Lobosporangium transversale]KAF9915359.1 hypothetical protein BX616_006331 [Lobosporangium transversale]ORZ06391.1 hypothetical protein BCR41DRAFT_361179 [Lobosporangium transversale]|eukprot:XP_021877554.1 hypothetical protein BCR41DRAFT_361179 [Lobosporangium transversale]